MVVYQSLIVGVIGFALGVIFSFGLNSLASQFVPEFVTEIRLLDVLIVGGVAAVMSVLAALIPIRRVASIDPALVFRA
jgi:ABC-type antimicrobial peptide transport system permease subunit